MKLIKTLALILVTFTLAEAQNTPYELVGKWQLVAVEDLRRFERLERNEEDKFKSYLEFTLDGSINGKFSNFQHCQFKAKESQLLLSSCSPATRLAGPRIYMICESIFSETKDLSFEVIGSELKIFLENEYELIFRRG
jgi:hypothetical protein